MVTITAPTSSVVQRATTMTLTWTTSYPQSAYEVDYKLASSSTWNVLVAKTTSTAKSVNVSLANIQDFSEYHIKVISYSNESSDGGTPITNYYTGTDQSAGFCLYVVPSGAVSKFRAKVGSGLIEIPLYTTTTTSPKLKARVNSTTTKSAGLVDVDSVGASQLKVNTGTSGIKAAALASPKYYHAGPAKSTYELVKSTYNYYGQKYTTYTYNSSYTYTTVYNYTVPGSYSKLNSYTTYYTYYKPYSYSVVYYQTVYYQYNGYYYLLAYQALNRYFSDDVEKQYMTQVVNWTNTAWADPLLLIPPAYAYAVNNYYVEWPRGFMVYIAPGVYYRYYPFSLADRAEFHGLKPFYEGQPFSHYPRLVRMDNETYGTCEDRQSWVFFMDSDTAKVYAGVDSYFGYYRRYYIYRYEVYLFGPQTGSETITSYTYYTYYTSYTYSHVYSWTTYYNYTVPASYTSTYTYTTQYTYTTLYNYLYTGVSYSKVYA